MGQNLALMELKIVTSAVLKRYTVSVGKAMRGDEMEMRDHFVLIPKGRCELVFESVSET
jgi:cytochrome P450